MAEKNGLSKSTNLQNDYSKKSLAGSKPSLSKTPVAISVSMPCGVHSTPGGSVSDMDKRGSKK